MMNHDPLGYERNDPPTPPERHANAFERLEEIHDDLHDALYELNRHADPDVDREGDSEIVYQVYEILNDEGLRETLKKLNAAVVRVRRAHWPKDGAE